MPSVAIARFLSTARRELARRAQSVPLEEIKALSRACPPARDARAMLLSPGCAIIPEIKRTGPAQGTLRELDNAQVGQMAASLAQAGAQLIAVQTEPSSFAGSVADLRAARAACSVPIIARDFFFDPYQVHEARAYGADMVPLSAELLSPERLAALIDRVESLGMSALVEARSFRGVERALGAGARILGVDARDVTTGEVDRGLIAEITTGLSEDIVRVALSGVRTVRDVLAYASAGADAVVVGEAVMVGEDPTAVLKTLVAAGQHPACPSRASA